MSGRNSATFERPTSSLAHRTDDGSTNRRLRLFRDHWLSVLGAFMELRRARVPVHIENTELTYRMERMWRLLFEDATEGAGNLDPTVVCAPTLPPCWNFVAREGILGDIAGYASIDLPCGMLEYTLGWFERLLTDLACMDVVELLGNTGRRYVAKLQTTAWRPVEQLVIDAGAALYVCEPSEEDVDTMVPFLSLGQSVLDVAADAFSGQTSLLLARLESEVAIAIMRVALQCIRYEDVRVRRLAQPIILELLGAVQRQQQINLGRNTINGKVIFNKRSGGSSNNSCYGRDDSFSDDDSDAGDSLMGVVLDETGVMNVLTGLLRKAFMALVLQTNTNGCPAPRTSITSNDEPDTLKEIETRRKVFWQRWRLVHDVYRLAREEYSSPIMRQAIEHAIHRNVLVYVRAAITRRPTPEAIEALECVTDIMRSIEDDYNLLHLLLDATILMPSCAAAVSRMMASRDDRISLAALWAIHETIRLGDPISVSDLIRSPKDTSYQLMDSPNSIEDMPDGTYIEQILQISQRMLALSQMIDEGGALHSLSDTSRKGPLMEYVRAAFDRCAARMELKEQYDTFFNGTQRSRAQALRRQMWAGVSHIGLVEQLLEQLSQPLTASFRRNLLVTSVLAQLIAMQDNADVARILSNSALPNVRRGRQLVGHALGSRNILQNLEQVTNDILKYTNKIPAFDIRLKIARISPWRLNSEAAKKAGISVVRPLGDGSFGGQGRPTPRRRVARCPTLATIREINVESINVTASAVAATPIHAPQARRHPSIIANTLPNGEKPTSIPLASRSSPPPRALDSSTPPTPVPMDDDDASIDLVFEQVTTETRMNMGIIDMNGKKAYTEASHQDSEYENSTTTTTSSSSSSSTNTKNITTSSMTKHARQVSDSSISATSTTTTTASTKTRMGQSVMTRPKIRVKPPSPVFLRSNRQSAGYDPRQPPIEQLVHTALVVSEFCKEAACLVLVKPLNRIVRCNENWSQEQHEHYSRLTESLGLNRL